MPRKNTKKNLKVKVKGGNAPLLDLSIDENRKAFAEYYFTIVELVNRINKYLKVQKDCYYTEDLHDCVNYDAFASNMSFMYPIYARVEDNKIISCIKIFGVSNQLLIMIPPEYVNKLVQIMTTSLGDLGLESKIISIAYWVIQLANFDNNSNVLKIENISMNNVSDTVIPFCELNSDRALVDNLKLRTIIAKFIIDENLI